MRHFILMLLGICPFTYALAVDNISFKHLGTKEGLSHNQINHITKDSQGFIWISTHSGLNRYDGYNFKIFTRDSKNPYSLPDNYVNSVQEDAEGRLWVHTALAGYVYYDPEKETFHAAGNLLNHRFGIAETPSRMYVDGKKNLWCYTPGVGTYQYNFAQQQCIFYSTNRKENTPQPIVTHLTEDKNGILQIYNNGTIECLDRQSNRTVWRNDHLTENYGRRYSQYSIFVDNDGDYWIYTKENSGLWTYYTKENKWEYYNTAAHSPYILSSNIICDIIQDNKGLIWLATDHGGANIINKELNSLRVVANDPFNSRSLIQNSINCLYVDESGIIWIGSYKRGVSYYNESIFKFKADPLPYFNHINGFIADVNAIVEDKHGNLWLGSNSSGIIRMNRETKEYKIFQHTADKRSPSSNVIVSLLAASDGRIWAGTFLEGLNVYDGQHFTCYRNEPGNPQSLANNSVWSLAEGDNGHIWVGTLGNGLQSLDPRTGIFTNCWEPGSVFAHDFVSSICIGRDKNLYMGTANGISIYNPTTRKMEKWFGNKKGTQRFSHNRINVIYEDSRGLLWLATQEGVNIYDRRKDEIIIPDNELTFTQETIHAIIEDNNKNMWITTTRGVTNTIVNVEPKNGTYTYTSYRYTDMDGLQDQTFNMRSIAKTFRGEIIAGGIHGLSFFEPEHLKYNNIMPDVVFTGIQLFNNEVKIDSLYHRNRILTKALNRTSKVELEHSQNMFSISFSSMNYILPEKTQYLYMLEGFNSNWLTADGNKVTYTNLAPGKYTLKVKAVNSDGFSNDKAAQLQLVIRPPFWQSPWAYLLYFLFFMGILWAARKQLLRSERNKYQLSRIEQEAQQKHDIDDMKLRFFTNISHELRTPLTLIISPLENIISTIGDQEQKQRLEMVHRNAIRLLNMVNQLLDFRKSDVKGHQLNVSQGDIVEFVRNISTSFTEYSEKKNVHLTFFSPVKELPVLFDEDKMGKIIMNLLSNAFKFTPAGGRVDVELMLIPDSEDTCKGLANLYETVDNQLERVDDQRQLLEIKISDTGIGIKDEDKERIFERFYQVQHTDNHKFGGSGVGLHLAKEFITLHDGTINVVNNIGQGSVFVVRMNLKKPTASFNNISNSLSNPTVSPFEEALSHPEHSEVSHPIPTEEHNNESFAPVILLVDDSDDFRLFMKDSLKAEYNIVEAADGAQAWNLIPTLQPDIIVSDVMMPEIDGIGLSKLVKNDLRTSHIPLILLTARSAEEQKLEGLESGADDYITKPFNFDILSLRIKKMLQLRQKRQENFNGKLEVNPSEITITSLDEKLIKKAIKYVENNISRCELSVEELSRELGMSRVHLYKKLLSITGKSPIEFIRVIRLKRAAQLLRESQQNVSEIAYQVGFNNPKYFSKYFKEEFGVLPSVYQGKEGK